MRSGQRRTRNNPLGAGRFAPRDFSVGGGRPGVPRILNRHQGWIRATFQPHPISILWPPNSILLAALVLTRPRYWWLLLAAAFPAHLAAQFQGGVPFVQIVAWFISNCSEALIGAGASVCSFDVRCNLIRFAMYASLSHSAHCGAFRLDLHRCRVRYRHRLGQAYATLWRLRFFSNVLTSLTLVPVIVTFVTFGPRSCALLPCGVMWKP